MRKLGVGRKERKGRKGQATPKARVKPPPDAFPEIAINAELSQQRW